MDALTALQYLPVLLIVVLAAIAALAIAFVSSRRTSQPSEPPQLSSPILPNVMLLLAGAALGFGLLLLVPELTILTYFPSWPVDILLIAAAAILVAPFIYLWRARSF